MSRYRPRHSSHYAELERTAPVRRTSRRWTVVATVVMALLVWAAIATSGGAGEAWRTLSGQELKEREAEIRTDSQVDAPGSSEAATETVDE